MNFKMIVVLFVCQVINAQDFEGVITDLTTNEPIELVSIFIENSGVGTVSNEEGKFRLQTTNASQSIKFSHINYKPFTLTSSDPAKFKEVYLEPLSIELEEVVILHQPIPDVLKSLIANSKRRVEKGVIIDTYSREFIKFDNKDVSYSDGLLQYHIKSKKGAADTYVDQSRVIKNTSEELNGKESMGSAYNIRKAISEAYDVSIAERLMNSASYDYVVKKVGGENQNLIRIDFTPIKETQRQLLEGSITYDADKNLILHLDLKNAKGFEEYAFSVKVFGIRITLDHLARKASFRIEGEKYILVNNQNNVKFTISESKRDINGTYQFMSDLVTLKYSEGDFSRDKSERFTENTLFLAGNKYTSEFWNAPNTRIMTPEEQQKIERLK